MKRLRYTFDSDFGQDKMQTADFISIYRVISIKTGL